MADPTFDQQVAAYKAANADLIKQINTRVNLTGTQTPSTSSSSLDLGSLGGISKLVSTLASGVTGVINVVDDTVKVWQKASDLGIGFGNDAIGLRASIGMTRLEVDEYARVLDRAKQGFSAFGGIMSQSAKIFNQLSYDFGKNFGDKLVQIGYTTEEYNAVLALANTGQRRNYLESTTASKAAQDAAYNLAIEMDKVAQISGQSRKAQQDAMYERQQDARLQAKLLQEEKNGNQFIREQYNLTATQFRMYGKPMEDLVKDIYVGGALTTKSQQLTATLGGDIQSKIRVAMNELEAATRSGVKENIDRAQSNMQEILGAVAKRLESDPTLTNLARNYGPQFDILREVFISGQGLRDAIAKEQQRVLDQDKRHIDEKEALFNLAKQAELLRQSKTAEGDIVGANTTRAYLLAQQRLRDVQTQLFRLLEAGNEAAGNSKTIAETISALENVKTVGGKDTTFIDRYGGEIDVLVKKLREGTMTSDDVRSSLGKIRDGFENFVKTSGIDIGKSFIDDAYQAGKVVGKGFLDVVTDGIKNLGKATAPTPPGGVRHGGTIGETGRLKEIGNPIVQLKDKETVFTEEQLINFANNAATANLASVVDAFSSIETPKATDDNSYMYVNLMSEMFKDIQTKISPVNIPSTVAFDKESIENLGNKLSSTVESLAGSLKDVKVAPEKSSTIGIDESLNSVIDEFQKSIPSIRDTMNRGLTDLTTIIPKANQTQARDLVRIIPTEIQQARVEAQRQEDARRRTTESQPAEPATAAQPQLPNFEALDEIKDILIQLNTTMGSSAGHLSELVGVTERQVRATKRLDPNVSVR